MIKPKHLIVLMFCTSAIVSQELDVPKIQIEPYAIFKNDKREIPTDFIGKDSTGYYLLYSRGRFGFGDKSIRKFDNNLVPTGDEIDLQAVSENETAKDSYSIGIGKIKSKIIHVWVEEADSVIRLYHQNVDLQSFSLGPKRIITSFIKQRKKGFTYFYIDEDTKEFAVLFSTTKIEGDEENEVLNVRTFNSDLEPTNNYSIDFGESAKQFQIYDIKQLKSGRLLVLAKKYFRNNFLTGEAKKDYEHQLFKIQNQKLNKLTTIDTQNKHLRGLNIALMEDANVILVGLYSNNNLFAMAGTFFAKVNLEDGAVIKKVFNPITPEFALRLMENGKKKQRRLEKLKGQEPEIPYYILQNTILKDTETGKEIILIAEQIHSFSTYGVVKYYHGNLAVINLDADGNIIWQNLIGKKQNKENVPIYSSFYPIRSNNSTVLLYNGNEENIDHKSGSLKNAFSYGGAFISTTIDDKTGDYQRKSLGLYETFQGITIRPLLSSRTGKNTLLVFGQDIDNLKNQRFYKVTFN